MPLGFRCSTFTDNSMTRCILWVCIFWLGTGSTASAQKAERKGIWPFTVNRSDKEGRHHGRWKLYLSDNRTLLRNGRFAHGKEVGKWKYYYPSGRLRKIEYHKRGQTEFQVKFFHENGALEKQGMARVLESERVIRYFWFGSWQVYDRAGNLTHTEYYEQGKEMNLTQNRAGLK